MDENENAVVSEDTAGDVLNDDWDNIDLSDVLDDETADGDEEAETADHSDEAEAEEPTTEEKKPEAEEATDQFTLKHLDEVRTVGRDEVIALAQKGMDYDRIRSKLDESENKTDPDLDVIRAIAKEQGMSVPDFVDSMKAVLLSKNDGIPIERATERVKMERREAEIARREAAISQKEKAAESESASKRAAEEKRDRDIREFVDEYKDVDFKSIPQEVWADVSKGKSLVDAYRKYENKKLREEKAALEKNAENSARTTGSKKGAGKTTQDEFLASWYADD